MRHLPAFVLSLVASASAFAQQATLTITLNSNPSPITQELEDYIATRPTNQSNLRGFGQGNGLNQYTAFSFTYRPLDDLLQASLVIEFGIVQVGTNTD